MFHLNVTFSFFFYIYFFEKILNFYFILYVTNMYLDVYIVLFSTIKNCKYCNNK